MKYSSSLLSAGLTLSASLLLLSSCGGNNDTPPTPPNPSPGTTATYVVSASVKASGNASSTLLLTPVSLSEGSISAKNNGLQVDGGGDFIYLKENTYLYSIAYRQGGKTETHSFIFGPSGLTKRSKIFHGNRFTTFGTFGDFLITTSTGDGPKDQADATGYLPQYILASYLDATKETQTNNDTRLPQFNTENYLGNGEFVTLCGLLEHEGKLYSGVIPMGLSRYGANVEADWDGDTYKSGKWVKKGNEDLVKTQDGGQKSSSYKRGELQWTQYPDECYVAIFSDKDFKTKKLIKTNKISYPAGRFKSQYHPMIWSVPSGDIYVFSPSFAKTMTDPRQKTKLPAGVVRIKKGAEDFDPSYYYNIDNLSGNRGFQFVYPVGGERFLIYFYDQSFDKLTNQQLATQLGIFDVSTGRLTNVTGLPADVSDFGGRPYVEGGRAYLPVNSKSQKPAIYVIDLATGQATRGLEVEATSITSVGRLRSR